MLKRHPLPSQDRLNELFLYDESAGVLYWKCRPFDDFIDERACKIWNTRYAKSKAGCLSKGAIVIRIDGKMHFAHRLIWKIKTGNEPDYLDHRDLNPSNNRFENLRVAEHAQNLFNVAGHAASGLKGVHFDHNCKNKPWKASVAKNGKNHSGGYFAFKEEAFAAACKLRIKLHGEFVRHGPEHP
jgi:hypothetical protein